MTVSCGNGERARDATACRLLKHTGIRTAAFKDLKLIRHVLFLCDILHRFDHRLMANDHTVLELHSDALAHLHSEGCAHRHVAGAADIDSDRIIGLNRVRRGFRASDTDFLLHGKYEIRIVFKALCRFCRFKKHQTTDAVVDGSACDTASRKAMKRGGNAASISDLHTAFRVFFIARADINVIIFGFIILTGGTRVRNENALCTIFENDFREGSRRIIDAADLGNTDEAAFLDKAYHKADLVHMSRKHQLFRFLTLALFECDKVTHRVVIYFIYVRCDVLCDHGRDLALVAGNTDRHHKFFELSKHNIEIPFIYRLFGKKPSAKERCRSLHIG